MLAMQNVSLTKDVHFALTFCIAKCTCYCPFCIAKCQREVNVSIFSDKGAKCKNVTRTFCYAKCKA